MYIATLFLSHLQKKELSLLFYVFQIPITFVVIIVIKQVIIVCIMKIPFLNIIIETITGWFLSVWKVFLPIELFTIKSTYNNDTRYVANLFSLIHFSSGMWCFTYSACKFPKEISQLYYTYVISSNSSKKTVWYRRSI